MLMKWIKRTHNNIIEDNDDLLEVIAKTRDIEDIERFLSPTKDEMFDPYLIKNIEEASNRIIKAIQANERIVVSYDPDADGLTSATVMIRYLKNYTDNVDYIYCERSDGHGIAEQLKLKGLNEERDADRIARSKENIEKVKNCDLLLLIDSSSNDAETCEAIVNSFGCDIVILDHHQIEKENPHVLLVNPQQEGDEYPNKHLSGAGVVFKVLQVMEDTLGQVDVFQYMDLVAVGMYADVMPVNVLENRFMIMYGLRNIKNVGLLRILKGAKVDTFKINSNAIGFTIAPLINGVARMNQIHLAIDILLTDDDNEAKKLRLKMSKLNEERKEIQKQIVDNYSKKVDSSQKILIVVDEQSSKGFNGLVAQQLSDTYRRPVIVGRLYNGVVSGSFRSYSGFDLKGFLNDSGLVDESIGHNQAGGFSVKEENLEALKEYIENNMPTLEEREPFVLYDVEISVDQVPEHIKTIEKFNLLTGNGFPQIVVKVSNVTIEDVSVIGKTANTVKIKTFDNLELIKFRVDEKYASELGVFDSVDVVGVLSVNEFYHFGLKEKIITNQVIVSDYSVI